MPPYGQGHPPIFLRSKTTFQVPMLESLQIKSAIQSSYLSFRITPKLCRPQTWTSAQRILIFYIFSWNQLTNVNIAYGSAQDFLTVLQTSLNVVSHSPTGAFIA